MHDDYVILQFEFDDEYFLEKNFLNLRADVHLDSYLLKLGILTQLLPKTISYQYFQLFL